MICFVRRIASSTWGFVVAAAVASIARNVKGDKVAVCTRIIPPLFALDLVFRLNDLDLEVVL
jgi:hypothetical protein